MDPSGFPFFSPAQGPLGVMLNGQSFADWLVRTGTLSLAVSLVVIAVWTVLQVPRLCARHRDDALAFGVIFLVALGIRFAVPWGPLDFAEASRIEPAWGMRVEPLGQFVTFPFLLGLLRLVGVHPAGPVELIGPVFGALGVGLAYLLARAADLDRLASCLAAAILLVMPAHVRYAAGGMLTLTGPAIWTGIFALALTDKVTPASKLPMLAASVVASVYARPEYRMLTLALVPLVFTPAWTWKRRLALLALLAAGLSPYVRHLGLGMERAKTEPMWNTFFTWLVRDTAMNPWWWLAAGVLGLFSSKIAWQTRLSIGLATGILLTTYRVFGIEYNPYLGEWRYAVAVTPFLAVLAAGLVAKVCTGEKGPRNVRVLVAATVLSGALYVGPMTRPVDVQEELAYVRTTAAAMTAERPIVVLLMDDGQARAESVPTEATAALGIALGTSPPLHAPYKCGQRPGFERVQLYTPRALLDGCVPGSLDETVLFLGLYRAARLLDPVLARYDLVPLDERKVLVAPATQHMNTQCVLRDGELLGSALPDCELTLGWYRLVPKGG